MPRLGSLIAATLVLLLAGRHASALTFSNATVGAGLSYQQGVPHNPLTTPEVTAMTGGAAAGDYDGDGWVDLFVTRTNGHDLLFRNQGDGTFADVTTTAFGANPINWATNGAAWADIDNDDDLDLYVTSVGEDRHLLYVNDGGVFAEAAASRGAGVGGAGLTVYGTGVAFGDYDRDGYLDAFVGEWRPNHVDSPVRASLLRNHAGGSAGHFENRTVADGALVESSATGDASSYSFAPRFTDLDGDRQPDLLVASDFNTSRLFWNRGDVPDARYEDGSFTSGIRVPAGTFDRRNDMGSAIGDVNGDGLLDWFVTDIYFNGAENGHPNGNRLFLNQGDRTFNDATDAAGVRDGSWGWGAALADFDNDGDLDLTMTNGFVDGDQFAADPMRLWQNDGTGVFTEVAAQAGAADTGQGRGLLTFDYDNDGDLDVFVVNNGGQPTLLRNDTVNSNAYLKIKTIGTASNRDGVGARILVTPDASSPGETLVREVEAGSQYLAMSESTAHFGLGGTATSVDEVLILWPSGQNQRLTDVPAGATLVVTETPGDFNGDGVVDLADFTVWRDSEGAAGESLVGDGNGDGLVNGDDYLLWQADFGKVAYELPTAQAMAIPEPSSSVLGFVAGGLLRSRGRVCRAAERC